jgi:hypothetical protein
MMLGCQDFCGYYDWTFGYCAQRWGREAVAKLWAQAIAHDAQMHYVQAGQAEQLAGLNKVWNKTGEDEHCDWTFTLDEERNVLRLDMRKCPSKGFLLEHDLNAGEDYCDHCIGWIGPMLKTVGGEVAAHQHNHCGQCWWEMRIHGKPYESLETPTDIRNDPRWKHGFIDHWLHQKKQPFAPGVSQSTDACEVLEQWFARTDQVTVLGRGPSALDDFSRGLPDDAVMVTGPTYARRDVFAGEPIAVLFGDRCEEILPAVAERFNGTAKEQRPLLLHGYLPADPPIDFVSHGLPRPVPILPLLFRADVYHHRPGEAHPTTGVFALRVAVALGKAVAVAGIDLYQHASGKAYVDDQPFEGLPARHSAARDKAAIARAMKLAKRPVTLHPHLAKLMEGFVPEAD